MYHDTHRALRNVARDIIPQGLKLRLRYLAQYPSYQMRLWRNFQYDKRRFAHWSSADGRPERRQQLQAWIGADYHKIEKALALRHPRPGFGRGVVTRLIDNLIRYQNEFGITPEPADIVPNNIIAERQTYRPGDSPPHQAIGTDDVVHIALKTIEAYLRFNREHGIEYPFLRRKLDQIAEATAARHAPHAGRAHRAHRAHREERHGQPLGQQPAALGGDGAPEATSPAHVGGGTHDIRREQVLAHARRDLAPFFASRHSIRQFAPDPVPRALIEQAVVMAQKTPSVCNRQTSRVYAFDDPIERRQVLACQRGNAGFGHEIQVALVVTSDIEAFFTVGERNQCWVDGGMFAMSLVYALHSLGLGTICLNWSVEYPLDRRLHTVAGIPASQAVIMMIGVGFLPERLRVTQSPRKALDEVLHWGMGPDE